MARLLLATLWIVTLALVATVSVVLYEVGGSAPPLDTQAVPLPARAAHSAPTGDGWRVVEHLAAHHVAVIEVETGRPQDARRIAVALVQGLERGYAEVLIYFRRPGSRAELPARRVQWSPATGYHETDYEAAASGRHGPDVGGGRIN